MIRVLLAEDQQIVREGLKALLANDPNILVSCEAADGEVAKAMLTQHEVDVALLDIQMPKVNGLQVTQYIKQHHPTVKVLILSMHKKPEYINTAINMGADGYLLKGNADHGELIGAIKEVADGGIHFGSEITKIQVAAQREEYLHAQKRVRLTPREKEVLQLVASGLTSKAISEKLFVAETTVETHRRHLLEKLNVSNVVLLVRKAIEGGYLD